MTWASFAIKAIVQPFENNRANRCAKRYVKDHKRRTNGNNKILQVLCVTHMGH